MTTDQAAAANLETFRETDGRFGSQPHAEAPLTLVDDLTAKRDILHDYIPAHTKAVAEAERAVYTSTMTLNALDLAAEGINVGRVFFQGFKENWWVESATDIHGFELDDESVETINETLHDSGVGYDPSFGETGLDLGELASWIPPADSVSERAAARVEKALTAATPAGEPETRATDLLSDLRHWADSNGVDLDNAYRQSFEHYSEEL